MALCPFLSARALFNLILPFSSLGLALIFLAAVSGPKWLAAKAADETAALVMDRGIADSEKDHPAVFWLLLLLALAPIAIVAILAAIDDGNPDVCV